MKELYPLIFKRKAVRKYKMDPLSDELRRDIQERTGNLKTLFPNIKTECQIVDARHVKSILAVKAPHYLVISSEEKEGYRMQAGYMLQQMDLYFSSIGLGSCWLGMAKPNKEIKTRLPIVIILAFGEPAEASHRELDGFKRKSLQEISNGEDQRLEAARLAPSATNSQKWFFIADSGKIHLYQEKLSAIKAVILSKMNQVDIGIALCHLEIASMHFGMPYEITVDKTAPVMDKYEYRISI